MLKVEEKLNGLFVHHYQLIKPCDIKMDIIISEVIFGFGKWVLQHSVFLFVSYRTLASIFIAALCLFAACPSQNCVHWL